jgi:hypothetical protein
MNRINHQSGLKNRQTREPEPNQQELSIYKNNITARRSNRNNYATKYWSTIQLQSTAEHEQEEGSGTPVPWKRDERALASIGKEILLGRDRREDWVGFVWRGDGEGAGFYRRLRWESVGKNQEESCEATARLTTAGAGRGGCWGERRTSLPRDFLGKGQRRHRWVRSGPCAVRVPSRWNLFLARG